MESAEMRAIPRKRYPLHHAQFPCLWVGAENTHSLPLKRIDMDGHPDTAGGRGLSDGWDLLQWNKAPDGSKGSFLLFRNDSNCATDRVPAQRAIGPSLCSKGAACKEPEDHSDCHNSRQKRNDGREGALLVHESVLRGLHSGWPYSVAESNLRKQRDPTDQVWPTALGVILPCRTACGVGGGDLDLV